MTTHGNSTSPADAKQAILDYCLSKGALAAGVADRGHRPDRAGGAPAERSDASGPFRHLAWCGRPDARRLDRAGQGHGLLRQHGNPRKLRSTCGTESPRWSRSSFSATHPTGLAPSPRWPAPCRMTCRMARSPPTPSCCSTPPAPLPSPRAYRSPTRAFWVMPGSAYRNTGSRPATAFSPPPPSDTSTRSTAFIWRCRPVRRRCCCPRSRHRISPGPWRPKRSPSCSPHPPMSPPVSGPGC